MSIIMLIFFLQGAPVDPSNQFPFLGASDGPFPSREVCMREGEKLLALDHRVSGFVCQ